MEKKFVTKYSEDFLTIKGGVSRDTTIVELAIGCVNEGEEPREEFVVLTNDQVIQIAHALLEVAIEGIKANAR